MWHSTNVYNKMHLSYLIVNVTSPKRVTRLRGLRSHMLINFSNQKNRYYPPDPLVNEKKKNVKVEVSRTDFGQRIIEDLIKKGISSRRTLAMVRWLSVKYLGKLYDTMIPGILINAIH